MIIQMLTFVMLMATRSTTLKSTSGQKRYKILVTLLR